MKNFEKYTHELNDQEKRIFDIIVKRFNDKPGKHNKATNKQIVAGLKNAFGIQIKEPRIRKIIHCIRTSGALIGLIATSSGYWRTTDPNELKSWLESLLERERAIQKTRQAGQRDLEFLLNPGQSNSLF